MLPANRSAPTASAYTYTLFQQQPRLPMQISRLLVHKTGGFGYHETNRNSRASGLWPQLHICTQEKSDMQACSQHTTVEHSNQTVLCLWQPQQNAAWDAYRSTPLVPSKTVARLSAMAECLAAQPSPTMQTSQSLCIHRTTEQLKHPTESTIFAC